MEALETRFLDKADTLDPAAIFEAYARVVPVFTANIITTADIPSGTFLATLIFKQVGLVETTLEVPGLLEYVVETTKRLVSSIHGVKRGEPLTLTGGVRDDDLMLVPATGAPLGETLQQKLERRRMEAELAVLDAAEQEAKARATAAEAVSSAIVARAAKEKRESTLVGQVFTPENVADVGISSLFSGAVMLAGWTSVRIAGKVAIGTVAAAGGLVQAGAQEAVSAAADLAVNARDAVGTAVAAANPFNFLWGAEPTPTPTPTPTPAPQPLFLDKAGQNADGMSSGLFSLLQLPFRQITTTDQIALAVSMFLIVDIATILVLKVGRKAFAKESSLVEVMSALKGTPKLEQDQRSFLQTIGGNAPSPALTNAPAPAPAPALTNAPAPAPVLALTNAPAPARALSLVPGGGDRKRRTFRNNKRRATRQKKKAPKVLGTPVFIY